MISIIVRGFSLFQEHRSVVNKEMLGHIINNSHFDELFFFLYMVSLVEYAKKKVERECR